MISTVPSRKNIYRNDGFVSAPNYLKYFTFNRKYNLRWNISKGLSLEYNALAYAIIDEPEGEGDSVNTEIKKNLKNFGRMKNFDQRITLNYTVPLDKFPLTDWLGADYRYQVNYNWRAGPLNRPDDLFDLPIVSISRIRFKTLVTRISPDVPTWSSSITKSNF